MKIVIFFFTAILLNNVQGQTPAQIATQIASYLQSHVTVAKTGTTFSLTWKFTPTSTQLQCFQTKGVNEALLLNLINTFGPALKTEFTYLCQNVIKATGCTSIGVTYGKTGSTYTIQITNIPANVQSGINVQAIAAAIQRSPTITGFVQQYGAKAIGVLSCFI